ncbi:hypothetical protein ONR57_13195 [Hoyosella sp. YIM 151337]|uniref:hypothetical protein n=1 Tax=Hoyosella sp. YIM 151337 TaxID=2992742 RepID=UPI0022367C29|nr:hypothetical protein [Hoyosella sp. YIM 151337]MCW4354256.1 hypothetical protein [Hoyosella sp. YIM 151337]
MGTVANQLAMIQDMLDTMSYVLDIWFEQQYDFLLGVIEDPFSAGTGSGSGSGSLS